MPARPLHPALARALTVAAAVALAGAQGGCGGASPATPTSSTAGAAGSGFAGAALPAGIQAPGFTLTDQRGLPVSLARYRGRVTILSVLYSTCGASCVLLADQIRGALDELGPGVPVLLISADPSADTRANVVRFLARASLSARAEYLTGSRSQLRAVWRAYRVRPPSSGRSAFARAATILLIDRNGAERVAFGLEQLTPEALVHDIRKLQTG